MVYKHAYLNILLLLHSTFMLCMVKMPLDGEFGGSALNNHGNYIIDHGKSWKKSWNCVYNRISSSWDFSTYCINSRDSDKPGHKYNFTRAFTACTHKVERWKLSCQPRVTVILFFLFTIVKKILTCITPLELMWIDRSLVYLVRKWSMDSNSLITL